LSGGELLQAISDNEKQGELITKIFRNNPGKKLSPSDVFLIFRDTFKKNYPITSIRRAMTDLSSPKCGDVLEKTAEMKIGLWNRPEHLWTLKSSDPQSEKPLPGKSVSEYAGEILKQSELF